MRKGRERSKCYYMYILLFCEIVKYITICSVFILSYEIKMENQKNFFFCQIGNVFVWNWRKKTSFLALGMGPTGDREPCMSHDVEGTGQHFV